MLVRFVVDNVFSFGTQREFNTLPNKRLKTLSSHKYDLDGFQLLKMSSIYGANGAGKSNLIKSLNLFQSLVVQEEIPFGLRDSQFKFKRENNDRKQTLAIEFIQENTPFYYGLELQDNIILTEELYISGLGKSSDILLFERRTNTKNKTKIQFSKEFENDDKSLLLKDILLEEFVKSHAPVLKLLSNRDNKFLKNVKKAFTWFDETLHIIMPTSKPVAFAHRIDKEKGFKKYAQDLMSSFNVGITALKSEKKNIKDFFGEDNQDEVDDLIKRVEDAPKEMIGMRMNNGDELIIVKEQNEVWVKELKIEHKNNDEKIMFDLDEESDGTIRLLDFVPAFQSVIKEKKVYVVDEIERSIHPLLIKELIRKFSEDSKTKGQLIFTTHESNLLDQELFRQDEIWFAEKDLKGMTDLYSLSDFKEHKTIDIRKGYLSGRYGSIPFLGNLQDLKWHQYDIN